MAATTSAYWNKVLKVTLIIACALVLLFIAAQLWLEYNTKQKLKQLVEEKSGGTLYLQMEKIDVNVFSRHLKIINGRLGHKDTVSQPITYQTTFRRLNIQVPSILPLLFGNLKMDSIKLQDPVVKVVQWQRDTSDRNNNLSITQEMGRMYNAMLLALEDYGIKRIVINNAAFAFDNKLDPTSPPTHITKVDFDLLRTAPAANERGEYVAGKQSVSLRTTDQFIHLPGGRHKLSFANFRLQLFNQRIVMDSCTLIAQAKDETESSYQIFLDTLILSGVDFDAMYQQDVINADSVYCINPVVQFRFANNKRSKTSKDDAATSIGELAGKLDLKYIGVKNAGIALHITGKNPRTIFNSKTDDINIYGLKVNVNRERPLQVDKFDVTMKDYRMYNEDSSSAYGFSSLQFEDDNMTLVDFFIETDETKRQDNLKDFSIPYFTLGGIDWNQLAFEENLVATEALLVQPRIRYEKNTPPRKRKRANIFSSLETVNELLSLQRLRIVNGDVFIKPNPGTAFQFRDLTLDLQTNHLLQASSSEGIVRAVNKLSFKSGHLQISDMHTSVVNVGYAGNRRITIDHIKTMSNSGNMNGIINDILLDNVRFVENEDLVKMDRLQWKNASLQSRQLAIGNGNILFDIKNISGGKTDLAIINQTDTTVLQLENIHAATAQNAQDGTLQISGLHTSGNYFESSPDEELKVNMKDVQLASLRQSKQAGIEASQLQWHELAIELNEKDTINQPRAYPPIQVTGVDGGKTKLKLTTPIDTFSTEVLSAGALYFHFVDKQLQLSPGAVVKGKDGAIMLKDLKANVGNYEISNNETSVLNDVRLHYSNGSDTLNFTGPQVSFVANINALLQEKISFAAISMTRPGIYFKSGKQDRGSIASANIFPGINVNQLQLDQPRVQVEWQSNDTLQKINLPYSTANSIKAASLSFSEGGLALGNLQLHANGLQYHRLANDTVTIKPGKLQTELSNIFYRQNDSSWQVNIKELKLDEPGEIQLAAGRTLVLDTTEIKQVFIHSEKIKDYGKLLAENIDAKIWVKKLAYADSAHQLQVNNFQIKNRTILTDSLVMHPTPTMEAFHARLNKEADYISLKTGRISLAGIDVITNDSISAIHAKQVSIQNPVADIFRDKQPPDPVVYKPLPVDMIRKIPVPIVIDRAHIINGNIAYTEKHQDTRAEGTIVIDSLNGIIDHIRNFSITNDTLQVLANGRLMEQVPATLLVHQSYDDSLAGFTMQFHVSPASLSVFNPIFAPTSNVKLQRGYIDTAIVTATANDNGAIGKIYMPYQKLKLRLIKDGEVNNTPLLYDLGSLILNTFIVKNANRKNHLTYFERDTTKSFFNYLFKITFSGMKSSMGLTSDYKLYRQYKAGSTRMKLPVIPKPKRGKLRL